MTVDDEDNSRCKVWLDMALKVLYISDLFMFHHVQASRQDVLTLKHWKKNVQTAEDECFQWAVIFVSEEIEPPFVKRVSVNIVYYKLYLLFL